MLNKLRVLIILIMIFFFNESVNASYEKLVYEFQFKNLNGGTLELSKFRGKVIVIVNVASHCGFTNQYSDMQNIWDKYKDKNLIMIGVPSNDFGKQEPGSSKEIKTFCETNFAINFPMTEKVIVKGSDAHPFYKWAKLNHGNSAVPKWNFHKIIIDKNGKVADTFSSITKPTSRKFIKTIEDLINR